MHVPGRPSGLLRHRRVKMQSLAVSTALQCGRGDRAPPRKQPLAPSPGMSPLGDLTLARPLEGRAPHARNVGITPTELPSPSGHRPLANSSAIMTRSGLRPARIRGRGDRAPPTKSPLALSPGFPRKALTPWLSHPLGPVSTSLPSGPPHPKPSPPPRKKIFLLLRHEVLFSS
jgi:hypothetical protein